ncbi:MAG: tetratricopeptide repeat protein, partial [Candidatus Marinimicrobia bacterium]|nr:tetratricopeptide repeat protein [Candidatus Neomarinimicrobiota bacterium]
VAISLLNKKESILKPLIAKHNGTYVKSTGDGSLSHFNSAVDAATCAKRLQESIYDDKDLNVRVGVHLGDTIFEKGDIRGDGVNIASRLESMAVEGGVFVSKEVHDQLANQKEFEGVSLGLQSMKGVGRLIEVYGLKGDKLSEPNPIEYQENKVAVHSDDEVPSIAIIPFENKGADEDVFYAYGISVDLISDVSSAGLIRVASKKQIEDAGDLPQDELAQKLFVRYIANGELWRMGDMFQLSVELYDTKDKKVVWSDRWQEKWDNLPTIKMNLSDGLLKALDTTSKVERKVETTNTEAYEFYLKAKYKYEKRENTDDTEIARGLLKKAIELDDNLILAKNLLGTSYIEMGDYEEAMEIYTPVLQQAKELGDKQGMGSSLGNIGGVHYHKSDYDTALDYYNRLLSIREEIGDKQGMGSSLGNIGIMYDIKGDDGKALDYYGRSLAIQEEIGDKRGMGYSLNSIGTVHKEKGDYDKALDYDKRSLTIREEIGDKRGMGYSLLSIGGVHYHKSDYDTALDYYNRSLAIQEEIGDKRGMGYSLNSIGIVHSNKGDYDKALDYLEKSLAIQKEIGIKAIELETTTYLYLAYKQLGKQYDVKEIHSLIKDAENIEFDLNLRLYELLEDKSYLETAYNQVKETADAMEDKFAKKFLSYPIPKAIVEEWEKVDG